MQVLRNEVGVDTKITLPTSKGLEFIKVRDIVHCQADSNYCRIYFIDGRSLLVAKTLKRINALLAEFDFVRVHHSHLINLHCIARYRGKRGGSVELENGTIVNISRSKKHHFADALHQLAYILAHRK